MKTDAAGTQIPETPEEIDHLRELVGNHTGLYHRRRHGDEPPHLYYSKNGVFSAKVSFDEWRYFAVIEGDKVILVEDPDLKRDNDDRGNSI